MFSFVRPKRSAPPVKSTFPSKLSVVPRPPSRPTPVTLPPKSTGWVMPACTVIVPTGVFAPTLEVTFTTPEPIPEAKLRLKGPSIVPRLTLLPFESNVVLPTSVAAPNDKGVP